MGYPYGKTYLEKIQENPKEMEKIRNAYYLLLKQRAKLQGLDTDELDIKESFEVLGEAFDLASDTIDGFIDDYHFMWDVLNALLPDKNNK